MARQKSINLHPLVAIFVQPRVQMQKIDERFYFDSKRSAIILKSEKFENCVGRLSDFAW